MNKILLIGLLMSLTLPSYAQLFSHEDYCLVWSDEFNTPGLPSTANWRYEEGYVRNNEHQYYTNGRLENARIEDGRLIIEARRDNWQGNEYTSASLVSWGKVVHQYGRFEVRAKIDPRTGAWPAFWTLGERGEWPSNGEIDIMEFYNNRIHANAAWGTNTRWQGNWDSQNRLLSSFGPGWADEYHVWRMEWTSEFINLYVDDILMNNIDVNRTNNGNISDIVNPFRQPHYIILNLAIGGNNGGDPSNTRFPILYEIDYVRVYQKGNCNLDCNWEEGGDAYLDDCLNCVGGSTGLSECTLTCEGNIVSNPGFETGTLSSWTGWGTRSVSATAQSGNHGVQIGEGAIEMVVDVQPYTNYTMKAFGRKTGGGWFRLGSKDHGSGETYSQFTNTDWSQVSHTFKTGNATKATIYFYNGSGGTAFGDDIELQPAGCFITGTDEKTAMENIVIYPNPSSSSFIMNVPESGTIKIYNMKGVKVFEDIIDSDRSYGDALAPGLYSIHYVSRSFSKTLSWIKL